MAIFSTILGAAKSFGLVKVAGKFILSKTDWILGNWKLVLIGAQTVAIAGLLIWHAFATMSLNAVLNDMETAKISAEGKLYVLDGTLRRTDEALNVCHEINAANALAYADMAQRADAAERRAQEAAAAATTQVEGINDEAHDLRGRDTGCRRLDDPFPDWFDGWLRD